MVKMGNIRPTVFIITVLASSFQACKGGWLSDHKEMSKKENVQRLHNLKKKKKQQKSWFSLAHIFTNEKKNTLGTKLLASQVDLRVISDTSLKYI